MITSPVFSELVVVFRERDSTCLNWEVITFEILREMYQVKPFQLVFLPELLDSLQSDTQRELEISLELATEEGRFDFLDSPPTIRCTRLSRARWNATFPELK